MASQLADGIKYAEKNPAVIAGGASLALLAGKNHHHNYHHKIM